MCRSSIITYEDEHVSLGRVVWHVILSLTISLLSILLFGGHFYRLNIKILSKSRDKMYFVLLT
jgi:hypothetical protein